MVRYPAAAAEYPPGAGRRPFLGFGMCSLGRRQGARDKPSVASWQGVGARVRQDRSSPDGLRLAVAVAMAVGVCGPVPRRPGGPRRAGGGGRGGGRGVSCGGRGRGTGGGQLDRINYYEYARIILKIFQEFLQRQLEVGFPASSRAGEGFTPKSKTSTSQSATHRGGCVLSGKHCECPGRGMVGGRGERWGGGDDVRGEPRRWWWGGGPVGLRIDKSRGAERE